MWGLPYPISVRGWCRARLWGGVGGPAPLQQARAISSAVSFGLRVEGRGPTGCPAASSRVHCSSPPATPIPQRSGLGENDTYTLEIQATPDARS